MLKQRGNTGIYDLFFYSDNAAAKFYIASETESLYQKHTADTVWLFTDVFHTWKLQLEAYTVPFLSCLRHFIWVVWDFNKFRASDLSYTALCADAIFIFTHTCHCALWHTVLPELLSLMQCLCSTVNRPSIKLWGGRGGTVNGIAGDKVLFPYESEISGSRTSPLRPLSFCLTYVKVETHFCSCKHLLLYKKKKKKAHTFTVHACLYCLFITCVFQWWWIWMNYKTTFVCGNNAAVSLCGLSHQQGD